MTRARLAAVRAVIATTVGLVLYTVSAAGQAGQPEQDWKPEGPVPRAADGKPDLSGVWWLGREPAVEGGRVGSPGGERGAPPPGSFASLYQPWAAEKARTLGDKDDPSLRCIPSVGGPPGTNIFQLVQTPRLLVLLQETFHGFRLIPTEPGRPHSEAQPPAYWGDSVGRWEGDTLIVDVTNFNDRNWISPQGIISFHSDALHVVERYRRIAANALEVEKTYDDPKVLIRPWVDKKLYRQAPFDQVMEAMCTGTETAALMEAASKENYGRK
jgi:hypothetical protein